MKNHDLAPIEAELVGLCRALGAGDMDDVSAAERAMLEVAALVPDTLVDETRASIAAGADPLGDRFCELRSPEARRGQGATYTPAALVDAMVASTRGQTIDRVVDPGAGSGRFLRAAAELHPGAQLVAVELDPLAALMTRATLAVAGLADRAKVHCGDYRAAPLEQIEGRTLFVGNPPYVRHHDIEPAWKAWLTKHAQRAGLRASQLAGLHVHFMLATAEHARPRDLGCFITAAEWLDVNYGSLARQLLEGHLGLRRLDRIDPTARPFEDAQTTAVIASFEVGTKSRTVTMRMVTKPSDVNRLQGGRRVARTELAAAPRWSPLFQTPRRAGSDQIELGELCRVHRGQVTGANRVWIVGPDHPPLPSSVLQPTVTKARELFSAGRELTTATPLRLVVDLPADLAELPAADRRRVKRFLSWARSLGADESYIAQHRNPWWAIKLREPAPILATYMARRPPAFVRNSRGAAHINIAHGLYPRQPMTLAALDALAHHLSTTVTLGEGRVYAGGLTKFEPKEMERLLVPRPEVLEQRAAA